MLEAAELPASNPTSLFQYPNSESFSTTFNAYRGYIVFLKGMNAWATAYWGIAPPTIPQTSWITVEQVFTSTDSSTSSLEYNYKNHWNAKLQTLSTDLAMIESAITNKRRIDVIDSILVPSTSQDIIAEAYDWEQSPSYSCYYTFHTSAPQFDELFDVLVIGAEATINNVPAANRLNLASIVSGAATQPALQPYNVVTFTDMLVALGQLNTVEQAQMISWFGTNLGLPGVTTQAKITANITPTNVFISTLNTTGNTAKTNLNVGIGIETAALSTLRSYLINTHLLRFINTTSTDPGTKKVIEKVLNTDNVDYRALSAYNNPGSFKTEDSSALEVVGVGLTEQGVPVYNKPKTTLELVPCSTITPYSQDELANFQSIINQLDDNLRQLKKDAATWYRNNVVAYMQEHQYYTKRKAAGPTTTSPNGTSKDLSIRLQWQAVNDHVTGLLAQYENDWLTQIRLASGQYEAAKEELDIRTCYGKHPQQAIDSCNEVIYKVTTILDSTL